MVKLAIPEPDCELWYDGCVVCPTSELKDFRKEDVICNPETCDMELRKTPYCVQEFENTHKFSNKGIEFCSNSSPQLCRRVCLPSEYPECESSDFCVQRINRCCEFECKLKDASELSSNKPKILSTNKEEEENKGFVLTNMDTSLCLTGLMAVVFAMFLVRIVRSKKTKSKTTKNLYEPLDSKST